MTAQEMFKKLGYKLEINNEMWIKYAAKIEGIKLSIRFKKTTKEVEFYYNDKHVSADNLSLKLLLAIIQQCKELGWI